VWELQALVKGCQHDLVANPPGPTASRGPHRRSPWWLAPLAPALAVGAVALASEVRQLAGVLTVVLVTLAALAAAALFSWRQRWPNSVKALVAAVLCGGAAAAGSVLPPDLGPNWQAALPSNSPSGSGSPSLSQIEPVTARPRLAGATLVGADLRTLPLRGADLRGANLRGTDLRGVDLTDACLRGADLVGAQTDERTILTGADLTDAEPPSLRGNKPSARACQ